MPSYEATGECPTVLAAFGGVEEAALAWYRTVEDLPRRSLPKADETLRSYVGDHLYLVNEAMERDAGASGPRPG